MAEREGWEEERDRRPVRSVHEEEMELALKMSLEAAEEDEKRRRERRERGGTVLLIDWGLLAGVVTVVIV